ncbi:MAG: MFS transporter [Firmicutes bacterium HGW-Firmicutes-5]|nr:MAG: MFS transporter [Firmicutes bacterium HGW-Firmicutes-5]
MKFGFSHLKLSKDIYILLSAVLIMHIASYLIIPILPIVFKSEKGINTAQIGIIIGAGSIAFQVGNVISGIISDRIGKKTTMIIGSIIQTIAFIGYGFSNGYLLLIIFSTINGVGNGVYAPTLKAAISVLASDSAGTRTTAFSLRGISANIGTSIGGLILLFIAISGSNLIFFLAAGTYALLALFTLFFLPKDCNGEKCPYIPFDSYKLIFKNKAFLVFGILVILYNGIYSLLEFLLPLRADAVLENGKLSGSIFAITSLSVIIMQSLISKYFLKKYNPLSSIFVAMLFFAGGLYLIGISNTFILLTISAVVFTIGQMFMLPITDSVVSQLADASLIGAYFSIANLFHGLGSAGGAFIAGHLINTYGIKGNITPWLIFTLASIVIGILIVIVKNIPSIKKRITNT